MRESPIHAVSVDTASIQRYVFASNKLKENIGASYIIEELLYKELMITSMRAASGETEPNLLTEWEKPEAPIALEKDSKRKAEIGYIGGGNALLMFAEEAAADAFVTHFSRAVLLHFPGIRVVYGRAEATWSDLEGKDDDVYQNKFQALRQKLKDDQVKCKNGYYAPPILFKPGIVKDCPSSNEAAEFDPPQRGEASSSRQISGATLAKLNAAEIAFEAVQEHYKDELGEGYILTNEIELLHKERDKSYVAVVHADGNGIGNEFMKVESLGALRELSKNASEIADQVMRQLITHTIALLEGQPDPGKGGKKEFDLQEFEPPKNASKEVFALKGRKILPIRPILAAGDDITFVCEGRLGVYLAAQVIKTFEASEFDETKLSACAGVTICKTHYPFFKAYSLAEELIQVSKREAKREARQLGEKGKQVPVASWLHFLAVPSGFNGDLEDVLESQFTTHGKHLLSGPYRIRGENSLDEIIALMDCYQPQGEGKGWPRSKLMEMRGAFRKSSTSQRLFVEQAKARGLKFHREDLKELYQEGITTPGHLIYDAIELIDFYPQNHPQP